MATNALPLNIFLGGPIWTEPFYTAAINATLMGSNTVVAAVAGKRIAVVKYKRIASAAVTATWESSGGLVLDGPCALAANGGEAEALCLSGHFATVAGEGLVLYLSGATQVGGNLLYILI